jgi:hypothetical protein
MIRADATLAQPDVALARADTAPAEAAFKLAAVTPPDANVSPPGVSPPSVSPPSVSPPESSDECVLSQDCIDQYLWSLYERARKIDTIKVSESFKVYRLMRAADEAGLAPGITSGFRDDYRQSIASGRKAATDSSYHGGSRRGGYGHGLAADVVSTKGDTRAERWITTDLLWKWIDEHGAEYGIGRPYLDRDPPHIAPMDGKEYVDKRGVNGKRAGS